MGFRDFPDVYHPQFEADADEFAGSLSNTAGDPAFIGYFLMNEPTWGGFSSVLPAVGMLYNNPSCATRTELSRFLKRKYANDAALAAAWKMPVTLAQVESGKWQGLFTGEAQDDLRDFTVQMVERYFSVISRACRQAGPHHLNLGTQEHRTPRLGGFGDEELRRVQYELLRREAAAHPIKKVHDLLKMPVMIGEYHFRGAGCWPARFRGERRLKNQGERGKAYRVYLEDAVADPYCVGAHWFQLL